ncbi:MAG: DUF4248 domain-containing protein [Bacteroidales bacterium]|nr:DUF4248 domain-containing protein [Bacteroidales bacterium]
MRQSEPIEPFRIRCYSKTELALLYTPNRRKEHVWRMMHNWITRCKPLHKALIESGMKPSTRILSPRQVQLIVEYLGEP